MYQTNTNWVYKEQQYLVIIKKYPISLSLSLYLSYSLSKYQYVVGVIIYLYHWTQKIRKIEISNSLKRIN